MHTHMHRDQNATLMEGHLNIVLKEAREGATWKSRERAFQAEGIARGLLQGIAKRLVWGYEKRGAGMR